MPYPQGISFRATSGYVTDVSPSTYEISDAVNYPRTTPQGNSVGYEDIGSGIATRDRNNTTNDPRLAGLHANGGATDVVFRMDLSASGSWKVRSACGDQNYGSIPTLLSLYDDATLLTLLSLTNTSAPNSFRDATDVELTAANWPANNTSVTKTFATTICRVHVTAGVAIAHLYLESAGKRFVLSPS